MRADDFQNQTQRLIARYGEKAYSADLLKLIWDRFGRMDPDTFRAMIDQVISEHFRPVGISTMQEISQKISNSRSFATSGSQDSKFSTIDCDYCDTFGVLVLEQDGYRFAFGCHKCTNGRLQVEHSQDCFRNEMRRFETGQRHDKPRPTCPPASWALQNGFGFPASIQKALGMTA